MGLEDRPLSGEGPWSRRDHHLDDRRCYERRCYDNYCSDDYDDCAYDADSCSDDDNYCSDNHHDWVDNYNNNELANQDYSRVRPARGRPKRLVPRFASRLPAERPSPSDGGAQGHAKSTVATVVR